MTYVSKLEKIFGLSNYAHLDCSSPQIKRSDGRLKQYSSIIDDRAWSLNGKKRYSYLYYLVTGSQTCLEKFRCHKYVPLEDLLNLLLTEKNDYIKKLEKQAVIGQVNKKSKKEKPLDELFRAKCFEDEEEKEISCLKTKSLTAELCECKTKKETCRKIMCKLENIDEIVNEIENMKTKLRCSEEMVKFLTQKKCKLKMELENIRPRSQIHASQQTLQQMMEKELTKSEELTKLAIERDNLKKKMIELQNELIITREKQTQIEVMQRKSEFESMKIMRENEDYKKKLTTMKCLERQIQELKKQANFFADKHKKDLETLREERNKLKRQVTKYEIQYNDLKAKLQQMDSIVAENEMLNSKLASLDNLGLENEFLRCKLEQCQLSEVEAAEGKEKIMELQCAVADQEEEMKDLLCQIEMLTRAYDEGNELDKLKEELSEKVCKLKICEERLTEIPFLEAEIDELRSKLEKQFEQSNSTTIKKKVVINNEMAIDDLTELGTRYEENVDFKQQSVAFEDIKAEETLLLVMPDQYGGKDSMTCEEVQNFLQITKGIISCVLEDIIERRKEMEELKNRNREIKEEIEILKAEMGKSDMDVCLQQVIELKLIVQEKQRKICCLEQKLKTCVDREKVCDRMNKLEREIECLRETNNRMCNDLEEAYGKIQKCAELEHMLEQERHARAASETKDADLSKMQKEEFNLEAKESFSNDADALRTQMDEMNKLIEELRKENSFLNKMIQTCPDFMKELDEKHALETLLNLLQNELDACRQNTTDNCEILRKELKRLKDQNCELKILIRRYKETLELESFKKMIDKSTGSFKDRNNKSPKGRCSKCSGLESSKDTKGSICNSQKPINSKSRILENDNNKLREMTLLHCKITTLCTEIYEKEKKICDQSKQIEKLEACIKYLLKKINKLRREMKCDENLQGRNEKFEKEREEKLEKEERLQKEKEEKLQEEKEERLQKEKEEKLQEEKEERLWREKEGKLQEEKEEKLQEEKKEKLQEEKEEKSQEEKEEKLQEEKEEKLRKEKEEKLRKDEEEKLRKEKEERLRKEKEEKLQKEKEGRLQEKLYEKPQTSEKIEFENEIKNLKDESGKLQNKLKECEKIETERNNLLEKQANMELEIKELKKLLAEYARKEKEEKEKISTKEDKLLEEMTSMRQQSAIYQEEADKAKAMNKNLEDEIHKLKKLVESYKKERANDTAMSFSIPFQSPKVSATIMPATEKQKVSIYEKATVEMVKKEGAEKPTVTEFVAPEESVKIITPNDDLRKSISFQDSRKKEKPVSTKILKKEEPKASTPSIESNSEIDISEVDPDFKNFLYTLSPVDHKWNICEIEKRYKKKMCEFKRKHDEKEKFLIDQFEKERNLQDKMFNSNMNIVKSGYETDIQKLIERHKTSIMRLQSLHEDEVQELNVNYETQMEAIQNQNENIVNDLTNRGAKKFEELVKQHNKDIREVEKKYQKLLHEKELQLFEEISKFPWKLNQNTEDVEERHNKAMKEVTETVLENIVDIQAKNNKEMKKLKQSNLKHMNTLRHTYKDLLMCEREKYEKQLEDMIQRLRQGRSVADGICQCRFESSCGSKDPNAPLEFNDILEKILSEGLASLAFNEVALVHWKTCAAAEDIILNPDVRVELVPSIAVDDACPRSQLMSANKDEVLKRIFILENEVATKQMKTQDAINNMELTIKARRKRLQELRDSLRSEKKNSELKCRLSEPKLNSDYKRTNLFDIPEKDVVKQGCESALIAAKKCITHKRRHLSTESEKDRLFIEESNPRHKLSLRKKNRK